MIDLKKERARLMKYVASLKARIARLKCGRRLLQDGYERLRRQTAPPAERPEGTIFKVIPKRHLNAGRWYLGIGRGSNVAF